MADTLPEPDARRLAVSFATKAANASRADQQLAHAATSLAWSTLARTADTERST